MKWESVVGIENVIVVDLEPPIRIEIEIEESGPEQWPVGYLYGTIDGVTAHYILEYWDGDYRVLAQCTSFEAALAAGRLMTGAVLS